MAFTDLTRQIPDKCLNINGMGWNLAWGRGVVGPGSISKDMYNVCINVKSCLSLWSGRCQVRLVMI